jgi:plasmid stabilization system protein ParE
MNTGKSFRLHPEAANDIEEIWQYIADDNVEAAGRVRKALLQSIQSLTTHPRQGILRPDLTSHPVRFKLVGNYFIAYAYEETPLWVLAVFHARRHPRVIAAMLRSREA